MSSTIDAELQGLGFAMVIVAVPDPADVKELGRNFVASQATPDGALAVASKSAGEPTKPSKPYRWYPGLGLMLGAVDAAGLDALNADGRAKDVQGAPQFSLIRPVGTRARRKSFSASYGLKLLKVPELWDRGLEGSGVLVGHLDTGIDGRHPALRGQIAHYAEFDARGDEVPNATPVDSGDHGTHTAGSIVGRAVGGRMFGVAPRAKLASGMVIEGGNVVARVIGGMEWLVAKKARLLSLSLGLRGFWPDFQVVAAALRRNGILPIVASGNEGPGASRSPGNYPNVLSVGACDKTIAVADFSCSQRFARPDDPLVPDIVGPGVDIPSCVPGNAYETMSGTSMATPHIAGLAALLLGARPSATVDELEAAILQSCALHSMLSERANRGLPDGLRALEILTGAPVEVTPVKRRPRKPAAKKAPAKKAPAKKPAPKKPAARKPAVRRRAA